MGYQCGDCAWTWDSKTVPPAAPPPTSELGACGAHIGGRAPDEDDVRILRYQQRHDFAGCRHAEGVCRIGINS